MYLRIKKIKDAFNDLEWQFSLKNLCNDSSAKLVCINTEIKYATEAHQICSLWVIISNLYCIFKKKAQYQY